ncbi:MAG: tetratricopeptide repeat protein [Nitrospinales bacterium]
MKLVLALLVVAPLLIYLAFLNPHEVHVYLTQSHSLRLPMVVFLFGSVLTGAVIAAAFNWTAEIRRSFRKIGDRLKRKRAEEGRRKLERLYEKGENAFAGGQFPKARSLLVKVLDENPRHVGALRLLGILREKEGKYRQAIELHEKALELAPENAALLYSLSENYLGSGQVQKAVAVLDKVREWDRGALSPLRKIVDFYLKRQDWDKAYDTQKKILPLIQDDRELAKERSRSCEIIYCKAMSLLRDKDTKSAISEFKRAVREDPASLPAYVALGDVYFQENNCKKALKTWKSGFENTKSPVCLQRMQKAFHKTNKPEETIKLYQDAIRSARNSEKEFLTLILGTLFLEQGKSDEALGVLEDGQDQSLIHRILLAEAYWIKKIPDKAEKTAEAVFDAARRSILSFVCNSCKASLNEWDDHCPVCRAWDSARVGPHLKPQPNDAEPKAKVCVS